MALLQIAEPGQQELQPHIKNIAIGIDLGTTNSLVASVKSGQAVVLNDYDDNSLIPSIVHYGPQEILVGKAASAQRAVDPENTIASVKRFMGRSIKDLPATHKYPYKFIDNSDNNNRHNDDNINNDSGDSCANNQNKIINIMTQQGKKNPIQVSADILLYLKQIAIARLGEEPTGVVVTVPAYFNDSQRQATKQAAIFAGLNVIRLLNEPTAAAIAYGLESNNEGTFLVYDLGGGTFDVSILRLNRGIFEVVGVSGDTYLGGDDFDQIIYDIIVEQINYAPKHDFKNSSETEQIRQAAKTIKEQLSLHENVHFTLKLDNQELNHEFNINITRAEFYNKSAELVSKTLTLIKKALRDAKLTPQNINEVILVGGSTRMPNIRQALTEFFAKPPLTNLDPDKVVALGAAILADVLVGNRRDDWLLLDVAPLSLGIETMGGLVEKIIPRNSTIPISKAQEFTTYQDNQTAMSIHIVQGERELAADCRSLAKFSLKGIPPMVAGAARIKVVFQIDADGLLLVSAAEETSHTASSIEVKPSFGLTADEISQMLSDSISHAPDDMNNRLLSEAIVDANALIKTVNNAIAKHSNLLDGTQQQKIMIAMDKLEKIIQKNTLALPGEPPQINMPPNTRTPDKLEDNLDIKAQTAYIKQLTKSLNELTQNFAAALMDEAVRLGLTGQRIDKI